MMNGDRIGDYSYAASTYIYDAFHIQSVSFIFFRSDVLC